ncbi:hypothetical protein DDZ14_07390 [Maritimibacter sp. 55A14]|uniref:STAS/SEC14 domain-containing protein n=1 Tax=Maritimibacter sp. 55A14 TaxID=2174844 RepID=UPI000D6178DE|nr:STAS/SEC14 domain-containing protein [Maritimibacter sp. 55A14]PWE32909.1 hypothetical protein DDZ14_07390 [Maritimibacter sp. 55A14]
MIEIGQEPAHNLVTMRIGGELSPEDQDAATPELEQLIEGADGALNAVIILDDQKSWKLEALWKALKFDVRHHNDFRRVAVVGQTDGEKAGVGASRKLTGAEVEFFLMDELDDARAWAIAT